MTFRRWARTALPLALLLAGTARADGVLMFGATGRLGSAIVRQLLKADQAVTVVRNGLLENDESRSSRHARLTEDVSARESPIGTNPERATETDDVARLR